MKFSTIIPYAFCVAAMIVPSRVMVCNSLVMERRAKMLAENPVMYDVDYGVLLDEKADALRDAYVENTINGCENVNRLRWTRGYNAAVHAELPGAPVGRHCLYGQTMQLSRAMSERGDTLTIVPRDARQSCVLFKSAMRSKYSAPEYDGCVHEGRMFVSDSLYNAARDKYLAQRNVNSETPDSVRNAALREFEGRNFSVDALDSGTMLIVPRPRAGRNAFHAIMLLGRGRIEDGKFVADSTGRHMYVGYNRESIGDLFKTYDASNVFAVDIRKIARTEYARELDSVKAMSRNDQLRFLEARGIKLTDLEKSSISPRMLQNAACAGYFGAKYECDKGFFTQNGAIVDTLWRVKGLQL